MRTRACGLSCRLPRKIAGSRHEVVQRQHLSTRRARRQWRRSVRCLAEEESSKQEGAGSRKAGSASTIASLNALLGVDEEEEKKKQQEEDERREQQREQREGNGAEVRLQPPGLA